MRLPRAQLLLPLLLQLADVALSVSYSRHWAGFNNHYSSFKPFKPKRARFAAPLHGFSNIFENKGIDQWQNGALPSLQRSAWSSYPVSRRRLQPIPLARNHYQSFPIPRATPAPTPARNHQFVPARNIQHGKVPTHFMTDAELHGLVCVPASSLGSALAGHQDHTTHHRDGTITTHRTVLAGTDGTTSHSTRITSAGDGTTVETRTNSSSGVQQHLQSVRDTGAGLVRTSTGSASSGGRPGLPTHADVITSSSSAGSNSQSRATASGYDVTGEPLPARSVSLSASRGMGRHTALAPLPPQRPYPRPGRPAVYPPLSIPGHLRQDNDLLAPVHGTPQEAEDSDSEEASSSEESSEEEGEEGEEEEAIRKMEDSSATLQIDAPPLPTEGAALSAPSKDNYSRQDEETSSQNDDEDSEDEDDGEADPSDDDTSKQNGKPAESGRKEGLERTVLEEGHDEDN